MTDLEKIELSIRRVAERLPDERIAKTLVLLADQIAADEATRRRTGVLEK